MSTASKSPRTVAAVALETGRRTLPKYSHRFSRKDFTLPQLFACLVLRKFFRIDYRGICAILADCPALREAIGLEKVPHFTTLQKRERSLLDDASIRGMLSATIGMVYALDSPASKKNALARSILPRQTPPASPPDARAATS